jgi:hypothetical protein
MKHIMPNSKVKFTCPKGCKEEWLILHMNISAVVYPEGYVREFQTDKAENEGLKKILLPRVSLVDGRGL